MVPGTVSGRCMTPAAVSGFRMGNESGSGLICRLRGFVYPGVYPEARKQVQCRVKLWHMGV